MVYPTKKGSTIICAECKKQIKNPVYCVVDTDDKGYMRIYHSMCPED